MADQAIPDWILDIENSPRDYTILMIDANMNLNAAIEGSRYWAHIPPAQQDSARAAWAAHQAHFRANPQFAYDPPSE